jgi:hypothetical protein
MDGVFRPLLHAPSHAKFRHFSSQIRTLFSFVLVVSIEIERRKFFAL